MNGRCLSSDDLRLALEPVVSPPESHPSARMNEVVAHLSTCEVCQQRLLQSVGGDDFLRAPTIESGTTDTIVELVRRLSRKPPLPATGTERESAPQVGFGQRIGRYEIVESLGRGGFAEVFLALDPKLDRNVALKIPTLASLSKPECYQRFCREAQSAALLSHPQIIPVYEIGQCDGISYIAFEYCPGLDLHKWFETQHRKLENHQATRIVTALADAVQHAHQRGIVHRDIKPSNVLVDEKQEALPFEQRLRIADFGLALRLLNDDQSLTVDGNILGTPEYMSPEQAAGSSQVGPATDIYSLGALLFELLSGRVPIRKETQLATLRAIETEAIPRLRSANRSVPRDLEAICNKCLEKRPGDRYASAFALAEDLRAWQAGKTISARPNPLWQKAVRWMRRNSSLSTALALAFVSLIVGLTVAVGQKRLAEKNFQISQKRLVEYDAQKVRALQHLTRLQESFDLIIRKYAQTDFGRRELAAEDESVLDHILKIQESLLEEEYDEPESPLEPLKIYHRIAELQMILGRRQQAIETCANIIRRASLVTAAHPEYAGAVRLRISTMVDQAITLIALGDDRQASSVLKEAFESLADARQLLDQAVYDQLALAVVRHQQITATTLGKADEALVAGNLYLQMLEEQLADVTVGRESNPIWLQAQYDRGSQAQQTGDYEAARELLTQVVAICHSLEKTGNVAPDIRNIQVHALADLGEVHGQLQQVDSGIENFLAAIELGDKLLEEDPKLYMMITKMAWTHARLATAARIAQRTELFLSHNQRALELATTAPPSRLRLIVLAEQFFLLGEHYRPIQHETANEEYQKALALADEALSLNPNDYAFLNIKRLAHLRFAVSSKLQRLSDETRQHYLLAFRAGNAMLKSQPANKALMEEVQGDLNELMTLLKDSNEFELRLQLLTNFAEVRPNNSTHRYRVAYDFALAALFCSEMIELEEELRTRQVDVFTSEAIRHLRISIEKLGFTEIDPAHAKTWTSLRHPDVPNLLSIARGN